MFLSRDTFWNGSNNPLVDPDNVLFQVLVFYGISVSPHSTVYLVTEFCPNGTLERLVLDVRTANLTCSRCINFNMVILSSNHPGGLCCLSRTKASPKLIGFRTA